jgi:hypothetical protein
MANWQRKTKPWSEYPIGTLARDHTDAVWKKVAATAWKSWPSGGVFPQPGADALQVQLPNES